MSLPFACPAGLTALPALRVSVRAVGHPRRLRRGHSTKPYWTDQTALNRNTAQPDLPRPAWTAENRRLAVITGAIKWGDANFAFVQVRRLRAHTPWPPPQYLLDSGAQRQSGC